jgi:chromatin segregation and condensation protein Rec8/ScpA/Scc1 (kleisin family)
VGDPIDIQDYMKLNIESVDGEKRLFEESDVDDDYVNSLESGESEYDLNYEYKDEKSANDNEITKHEEDWLTEWNKYWKWDENTNDFVHHTIQQINKAKKRKDKERNLKIKQLSAIYPQFDLEKFDYDEDYETEWTQNYSKYRVKNQYLEKKRIIITYLLLLDLYKQGIIIIYL